MGVILSTLNNKTINYLIDSLVGTCDKTTGQCLCREGFYGEACEYLACPAGRATSSSSSSENRPTPPCNGHGKLYIYMYTPSILSS